MNSQEIILIDNFLSKLDFANVYNLFMGDNFPWFLNPRKSFKDEDLKDDEKFNFQFTHTFYKDLKQNSDMSILLPIFKKLNLKSIVRIKANLTTVTSKQVVYNTHTDVNFECKTAVFYINNNNGFTIFEDGSKIDSIENRICIFPSLIPHAGTSCTDEKVRVLLNINYFD